MEKARIKLQTGILTSFTGKCNSEFIFQNTVLDQAENIQLER